LLDAAHIVMDTDEQLGQPIVSNGLPLTKLHHAAFDAHLIGIDPDFRIHVSDRLLEIHDGPFLELGLKGIVGTLIERPRRTEIFPIATGWRSGSSSSRKPRNVNYLTHSACDQHDGARHESL
jgi:hypothetical protein